MELQLGSRIGFLIAQHIVRKLNEDTPYFTRKKIFIQQPNQESLKWVNLLIKLETASFEG